MLAGLVIVPVVGLLPKPDPALVDAAFACYRRKRPVSPETNARRLGIARNYCRHTTKYPSV